MKNNRDTSREDYMSNRVMAVFTAAIVMLLGLTYLWNAYDVGRTFFAAQRINNILIWVSAAGLIACIVWLSADPKRGRLRNTILNGAMGSLFFLVLLGSLLLVRYNYMVARRVLYIIIPSIAILHLIYCSYQREFFVLCLTHSAILFGLWIMARTASDKLALLAAIVCLIICAAAVLVFLAASRAGGTLQLGRARLRVLDSDVSRTAAFAVYGVTALAVVAAYILGAPLAYYILYAMVALLVMAAIIFTVKLI